MTCSRRQHCIVRGYECCAYYRQPLECPQVCGLVGYLFHSQTFCTRKRKFLNCPNRAWVKIFKNILILCCINQDLSLPLYQMKGGTFTEQKSQTSSPRHHGKSCIWKHLGSSDQLQRIETLSSRSASFLVASTAARWPLATLSPQMPTMATSGLSKHVKHTQSSLRQSPSNATRHDICKEDVKHRI